METPTLVVSNPPHEDVDVEAASELLGLDIYITRLKVKFAAPEILSSSEAEEAEDFAAALRETGLTISTLDGSLLKDPPWPQPVSTLVFDESGLRGTVQGDNVQVPRDAAILAVYCRPPADFSAKATIDPEQAVASCHGPSIAEAIQWMANLDLYFREQGALRRLSIVPGMLGLDADDVAGAFANRFQGAHMDARLVGVRPRARFIMGEAGFNPDQRKRYSFGTLLLCHVLESISPDLRNIPHYEFASRLAYALSVAGGGSA